MTDGTPDLPPEEVSRKERKVRRRTPSRPKTGATAAGAADQASPNGVSDALTDNDAATASNGGGAAGFRAGMSEDAIVAEIVRRISETGASLDELIAEALEAGAVDTDDAIRIPFAHEQAFSLAAMKAAQAGATADMAQKAYWTLFNIATKVINPKSINFTASLRDLTNKIIKSGLTDQQGDEIISALHQRVTGQVNKRAVGQEWKLAKEKRDKAAMAEAQERLKASPIDYSDFDDAELILAARLLEKHDPKLDERIQAIMNRAIERGMGDSDREDLFDRFLSVKGKTTNRRILKTKWNSLKMRWDAESERREAAMADQRAAEQVAESEKREAELWEKIKELALSPELMKEWCRIGKDLDLVEASRDFVAVKLTLTSRLLNESAAICLLRQGASASGKNTVVEKAMQSMPAGVVDMISGSSPKSMYYEGGEDDVDAYKHRAIYVPEAVALSKSDKTDNEMADALRTLISEGRIVYKTVVAEKNESGQEVRRTKAIIKNGPIALITTSARDNVDPEMLTRMLVSNADESPATTAKIMDRIRKRRKGVPIPRESWTDTRLWRDFEEWLMLSGPYEVVVPFGRAILAAYARMPKLLRIRRDFVSIFRSISASTVIHKAQRKRDDHGRIIAELDDYRWTHFAFARSLSGVYNAGIKKTVIRLVEILENEFAAKQAQGTAATKSAPIGAGASMPDEWVQISHEKIRIALGIESKDAVARRISDAVASDIIEVRSSPAPGGSREPRFYRILIGSRDLAALRYSALPSVQMVRIMIEHPQAQEQDYNRFMQLELGVPSSRKGRSDFDEADDES